MKLSLIEVEHIANLARLQLTDEEKETYRQQLSAILDYAARLQQVDTSSIPPTSSVLPEHGVLREDLPAGGLNTDEILANAPSHKKRQFKVPPVME